MLNLQKMIQSAMEALGWPYVSPGTNDRNGIDCSGLFVKMYRDQGASIYHGSNSIFHQYCSETGKLSKVSQLEVGMAVFKCKEWTESDKGNKWYGKEPGNLSHIGFVVSTNPLEIIHASSEKGCVTTDTKIGKWKYWGKLKDVDYGGEPAPSPSPEPEPGPSPEPEPQPTPVVEYATVYSDNRKSVKLRAKPSTSCRLYDDVPFGAIVEVVDRGSEWSKVNYKARKGWYMMSKFLLIDEESIPDIDDGSDEDLLYDVTITISGISYEEAKKLKEKYPKAEISVG